MLCVGRRSFPFSAENPLAYTDHLDQLNVIFDVLGTPSAADIAKIENDKARNYLRGLPPKPPMDFARQYPGADPRAVELLTHLLTFDPDSRFTAEQALSHPYLSDLRVEAEERTYEGSTADFAFEDVKGVTKEDMRALIIGEILLDSPHLTREHFLPSKERRDREKGRSGAPGAAAPVLARGGSVKRSREAAAEKEATDTIDLTQPSPMEASAQKRRIE